MSEKQNLKGYKRFYPWLKWIFSVLSIYFFVKQLRSLEGSLVKDILETIGEHSILFIVIVSLALINWNAEAQKFKLLIKFEYRLSNFKAFWTILGGMAISNFTPARTGEYIGRGLLLKSVHPMKVTIATVTGNIAQVMMTYGIGLLCLISVFLFTDLASDWSGLSKLWIVLGVLIVLVLFLWNIKRIISFVKKHIPKKIAKTFSLVKQYDAKLFAKVVGIAGVRYAVFSFQFYLLLQLFSDFQLPVYSLVLIPIAYLLQSVAPVPAITDVGVRIAVSQLLFGAYMSSDSIVQAVTCLWFLNLILPGLLGTVYLLISTIRSR